jgi:potassium-transporting ATPase KdpC subunit
MKTFILKNLYTAVIITIIFTVVVCGIYPILTWGLGQLIFPSQSNGSLIQNRDHATIGSELIGQNFSAAKYFHPRPSAAGSNGYDATNSGGSNLGPTSQKLMDSVKMRVQTYRSENHLSDNVLVPADAVTASASGLDPHISVKNAFLQAPRVAQARSLDINIIKSEIVRATTVPAFGILGNPGVNVLQLNLALDRISPQIKNPME